MADSMLYSRFTLKTPLPLSQTVLFTVTSVTAVAGFGPCSPALIVMLKNCKFSQGGPLNHVKRAS